MLAGDLLTQFRNGISNPVTHTNALLERIDALDGQIGAFTHVDHAGARMQAKRSFERCARGEALPLDGLPIAIKEVIAVKGMPFTGQSQTREGIVADKDAEVTAALRQLGCVIVGMTRTSELACGVTTQSDGVGTRNPRDMRFIAGGSSGGSAAAVAAGFVPVALGSDTACSVRQPAACCGVTGYKPTRGLISPEGLIPAVPEHDVVGLIAHTSSDVSLVMQALGLLPPAPAVTRLGLVGANRLSVPQENALANAASAATACGVEVVDVEWPLNANIRDAMRVISWHATLQTHRHVLRTWPQLGHLYTANIRDFLASSESITEGELRFAEGILEPALATWRKTLTEVDAVLLPTMSGPPSLFEQPDFVDIDDIRYAFRDAVIPWNLPVNLLGVAACAIPAGETFFQSVQIAGRSDALVLDLAAQMQGQMPSLRSA